MYADEELDIFKDVSLQEVVSAKKFKFLGIKGYMVRIALSVLYKFVGKSVFFKVPENLSWMEPEAVTFLPILGVLKKQGFFNNGTHIITKHGGYADEPYAHVYFVGAHGGGVDFFSQKKSIWKALAEHVERYLWKDTDLSHLISDSVYASYQDLCRSRQVLNIDRLAGFSSVQREKISSLQYSHMSKFRWVRGYGNHGEIWVPLQLVSVKHFARYVQTPLQEKSVPDAEPLLRSVITTGLATGPSLEEAVVKGVLEVIERDAFMVSYLNSINCPRVDLQDARIRDKDIEDVLRPFDRYNLEVVVVRLVTDFSSVYVYAAIIIDRTGKGPAVTVGAKADFSPKAALIGSISESLGVRYAAKQTFHKVLDPDVRKMDRDERVVYWASSTEMIEKISFFFKGKQEQINFLPAEDDRLGDIQYYKKKMSHLMCEIERKGYVCAYVDLTPNCMQSLGLHTAFVIIPELQPLYLKEAIPYLGGSRLREVPIRCGYESASVLNTIPHPFP